MANIEELMQRFFYTGMGWGFQLTDEYEALFNAARGQIPYEQPPFPIVRWKNGADRNLYKELRAMLQDSKNELFFRAGRTLEPFSENIIAKMRKTWQEDLDRLLQKLIESKASAQECYEGYMQFFQPVISSSGLDSQKKIRTVLSDIAKTYFRDESTKEFFFQRIIIRFMLDEFVDIVIPCGSCGHLHGQNEPCGNPSCPSNVRQQPSSTYSPQPSGSHTSPHGSQTYSPPNTTKQRKGFPIGILVAGAVICILLYLFLIDDFGLLRRRTTIPIIGGNRDGNPRQTQTYLYDGRIRGTRVNIRTGPTTGAKSYGLFNNGFRVRVIEISGSWCKVEFRNSSGKTNIGWVHRDYVTR
jgi:hypothetical protein